MNGMASLNNLFFHSSKKLTGRLTITFKDEYVVAIYKEERYSWSEIIGNFIYFLKTDINNFLLAGLIRKDCVIGHR